jgi:hypothetical protein
MTGIRRIHRWAAAAVAIGTSLLIAGAASAAWSPAMRLVGSGSFVDSGAPPVAFDSHGVPWVVYDNANGLVIAAISPSGHLTEPSVVPVSRSSDTALLAMTPGGEGILAWSFFAAGDEHNLFSPVGIAAASWRPGHGTGRRVVVAPPAADTQLDAAAVNARGTAEVLWTGATAGKKRSVFATRLLGGRLAGAQKLGSTAAPGIAEAGLTASSGDGFRASWQDGVLGAMSSALPPSPPIETAVATSGGVFGAGLSVPWPGLPYAGFAPTEQLVTNARGDQAVVWDQTGSGGMVTVFASSRRAGRPFSAAQQIAQATWPTLLDQHVAAVIGSSGQVTVMLTQPSQYPTVASATGEIIAASGQAGAPLGGSRLIASNEIPQREGPFLVLTPRGRAIAIWAATQRSGVGAIEAATSTDGAVFSIPQVISAPTTAQPECELPELLSAGGSDGALAAWSCTPSGGTGQAIHELARFK